MNLLRRGRILSHIAIPLCLVSTLALAQSPPPDSGRLYEPRDSTGAMWSIGAGMGLPYGLWGGKLSVGGKRLTGELGAGVMPLAWEPILSGTAVLHFRDRCATIRPKLSVCYSSAAAVIVIFDESYDASPFDTVYDEYFPGFGIYGGIDWRLGRTSSMCLDLNIGWTFASVGNDEVLRRYEEIKADLIAAGYVSQWETISLDTPKISVGVTYSPGRSQRVVLPDEARAARPRTLQDSDGDGVPDSEDREPDTPPDADVDRYGRARDDDGDGVPNSKDGDPFTVRGDMVDEWGVAIDSDHDGVADTRDGCPDTAIEYAVDRDGCPIEEAWFLDVLYEYGKIEEHRIYFKTADSDLLPESFEALDAIGMALSGMPVLRFEVAGHCDDRGGDEFNQELSERRAQEVVDHLLANAPGLTANQLIPRGYGRSRRIALGTDKESRALNRRVEFVVLNPEAARQQIEQKQYRRRGE